jgi:hypothetical protein
VKDAVPSIRRQSVNSSIEATTGGWGATGANRPEAEVHRVKLPSLNRSFVQ